MSRFAYVNGQYVSHQNAAVHIEDRGYQFGDGVYEVVLMLCGQLVDYNGHMNRLKRSLHELDMRSPVSDTALRMIMARLVRLNRLKTGTIYVQITRGVARRDHKFPENGHPSMVMTVKHMRLNVHQPLVGKTAITVHDQRWERRDIKTIQLLPNCLAKQKAVQQGADEAVLVMADGTVSEGASSNVWIVTDESKLITRQANADILNGITRQSIQKIAGEHQLKVVERPFTVDEMVAAKEVFITSASVMVTPITQIDDRQINDGDVGRITSALKAGYVDYIQAVSGNSRSRI